ncbi:hypothetical protein GO001_29625 [Streptomyces sp. NRRL B-1677]|uniref:DNA-binding protein n=1 Tax=Streptomyces klenkii TaxID=1420899 RepID=A0A3B0APU4_9ACTN|nr:MULTISPECIES: hypothetical protein [Streptomyces]MBF6049301.1 hypothetical protein [Streptomyces sp. NRRL B-1677]RKN62054.1 hypothetical protein D7231_31490 [Streptomyces klenkii]
MQEVNGAAADGFSAPCRGAGCTAREAAGRGKQHRRPAQAPALLCAVCRARLGLELMRLPDLYEECALALGASGPRREKVSGGPLPGMPFNATAADVRAAVMGVLGAWAALVVQERGAPAPRRDAAALSRFLLQHVGWLAAHSAAGEFSEEIARVVRRARRVIDPDAARQVAVGGCVEPGCTGSLTAAVRARAPHEPAEITCDADPAHHWLGHQWLQLSRRVRPGAGGAQEARWISAADIARLWAMAPGSVYRHASQSQWRRRTRAGRTYYYEGDVQRSLEGRKAGAASAAS